MDQFDFPSEKNSQTDAQSQKTFDLMPFQEYLEKDNKMSGRRDMKDTPKSQLSDMLEIIEFKSNKSKIPQRQLMELDIIPRHPSSMIMNGKSGSGKSTLLLNLCCMPQFYGPTQPDGRQRYHDLIFIFSPTATQDDLPEYLNLEEKYIITENFESRLEHIINTQRQIIEKKKIENSPKILIIFDDIQSQDSFMRSGSFLKCFIQNRHYNISTILCSQSFTRTPRACRLQASSIFFFQGSASEIELLVEEFCPPGMTKKQFMEMVRYTTTGGGSGKHSFMHINMKVPIEHRYRKNLNTILSF